MSNYYATAGLGFGVDVSHYGAPYQGMLGLNGLGQTTWSPGPGQSPADDPRMVKKYAVIRSVYRVRNVPSDKAGRLADLLLSRARALFPGNTVRKIGTTGWMNDGRVGYEVHLAAATRAGEIKQRNATARDVAAQLGGGAELYDAQTIISASDYMPLEDTMLPPSEQPVATPETSSMVGGLPVWAVAGIGVAAIGAIAFVALRKKPVTANRRRSRRRASRRVRKNAQSGISTKAEADAIVRDVNTMYKRMGLKAPKMRVFQDKYGWTIEERPATAQGRKRRVSKNGRR